MPARQVPAPRAHATLRSSDSRPAGTTDRLHARFVEIPPGGRAGRSTRPTGSSSGFRRRARELCPPDGSADALGQTRQSPSIGDVMDRQRGEPTKSWWHGEPNGDSGGRVPGGGGLDRFAGIRRHGVAADPELPWPGRDHPDDRRSWIRPLDGNGPRPHLRDGGESGNQSDQTSPRDSRTHSNVARNPSCSPDPDRDGLGLDCTGAQLVPCG